jgi:hypothetical protein
MNEQHKATIREVLTIALIRYSYYDPTLSAVMSLEEMRAKHDSFVAALAGLDEPGWEPVEDGVLVPTITQDSVWAYKRNGKLGKTLVISKDSFHGDIILADGYAVCRAKGDAPQ